MRAKAKIGLSSGRNESVRCDCLSCSGQRSLELSSSNGGSSLAEKKNIVEEWFPPVVVPSVNFASRKPKAVWTGDAFKHAAKTVGSGRRAACFEGYDGRNSSSLNELKGPSRHSSACQGFYSVPSSEFWHDFKNCSGVPYTPQQYLNFAYYSAQDAGAKISNAFFFVNYIYRLGLGKESEMKVLWKLHDSVYDGTYRGSLEYYFGPYTYDRLYYVWWALRMMSRALVRGKNNDGVRIVLTCNWELNDSWGDESYRNKVKDCSQIGGSTRTLGKGEYFDDASCKMIFLCWRFPSLSKAHRESIIRHEYGHASGIGGHICLEGCSAKNSTNCKNNPLGKAACDGRDDGNIVRAMHWDYKLKGNIASYDHFVNFFSFLHTQIGRCYPLRYENIWDAQH